MIKRSVNYLFYCSAGRILILIVLGMYSYVSPKKTETFKKLKLWKRLWISYTRSQCTADHVAYKQVPCVKYNVKESSKAF